MLLRAIIDHIPPIFDCGDFNEVANNYRPTERQFKTYAQRLEVLSRPAGDSFLHAQIRRREPEPTLTDVDFRVELNWVLKEIVAVLG